LQTGHAAGFADGSFQLDSPAGIALCRRVGAPGAARKMTYHVAPNQDIRHGEQWQN
jgi:hypothetical protein